MASLLRNPFSRLTNLGQPPQPGTLAFKAWLRMNELNNVVYRASGGRLGGSFDGNPVLLLHHVGRRSGEQRVAPLLYLRDGDDLVVVGSMGGTPEAPGLGPQPARAARHRGGGRARAARGAGREPNAEERARLWPMLVEHYPGFAGYQARTEREIPVVILSPRG